MELPKYIKYICLFFLGSTTTILYLVLTNNYTSLIRSLKIPSIWPYRSVGLFAENTTVINGTKFNSSFESRLSNWYPHLPIHIFSQSITSIGNTSKLILIGNGFFGGRNWGIAVPGRSSVEMSMSD